MKIKTSLRAGARGCSPEAQWFMQRALEMEARVRNCQANITNPAAPVAPPVVGGSYTYPDRSGWCG